MNFGSLHKNGIHFLCSMYNKEMITMPTPPGDKAAKKRYNSKFEIVSFRVHKGKRDEIKEYANKHGESINQLFQRLIKEEMERNP